MAAKKMETKAAVVNEAADEEVKPSVPVKEAPVKEASAKKAAPVKETVKKENAPVKETARKAAPVKENAKKEEPAGKEYIKKEEASGKENVKKEETSVKENAKKEEASGKAAPAKKAVNVNLYLQYSDREISAEKLAEEAKSAYVAAGNNETDIKTIDIYVKPEESAAYYAVNGKGCEDYKIIL